MPQSRRHHYVSQFYLRNFAADPEKPQLHVTDLRSHKTFTTSPENVAFERDFHAISVPGLAPDAVEKNLSQFEGDVAPAIARMIESGSLSSPDDARHVLYFATILLIKGPANRQSFDSFVNQIMQAIGKSEVSDRDAWKERMRREGTIPTDTDLDELADAILSPDYTIGLSTDAHLGLEFETAGEMFSKYVATRKWHVYRAGAGQFVTCDRPAVLMWNDPRRREPVGLRLPESLLLFPLSSTTALCGAFEFENERFDLDATEVAKINGRIILNANRQVYARDPGFEYLLGHHDGPRQGSDLLADVARAGEGA